MASYESFAKVYDELMDNVPYDTWTEHLIRDLKEYHITDGLICELGCGTGNVTTRLSKAGYDMIGVDDAEEMLSVARKSRTANRSCIYSRICAALSFTERSEPWSASATV